MAEVVFGRDDQLFLTNDTNRVCDQLRGELQLSELDLRAIAACHRQRQDGIQAAGGKYCHIIAPSKEMVLTYCLPDRLRMQEAGLTPVNAYLESLQPGDHLTIYRPHLLRRLHLTTPAFSRTDTHWSHQAALTYMESACQHGGMAEIADALRTIESETIATVQSGDLGSKIGLPAEAISYVRVKKPASEQYFSNKITNEGCVRLFRNPAPLLAAKLLYLHDSSGTWPLNHLAEVFADVCAVHYPDLDMKFLARYAPDYVIFVQTERFFTRPPNNTVDWGEAVGREEARKNAVISAVPFLNDPPSPLVSGGTKPVSAARIGSGVIATERTGLGQLLEVMRGELGVAFEAAVALLAGAKGRAVLTGMGKSGHIGRKIAATFASTGTPSLFVHPAEASHGDLGMVTVDDVLIALSWSGETAELADLIAYSRRFEVRLIAITSLPESTLAKAADVALILPRAPEACPNGLAPTTSTLMQLAIGDALAIALLSKRGFTASDFRRFHPGGKLGAQLKRVQDIMRPLPLVPHVPETASVGDALVAMSERGLSYALVLSGGTALAGIITDGDMRRSMAPDLMAKPVTAVMTARPKTFTSALMAAEALAFLNTHQITAAPVIDADGQAVGGVHIIDFVKAGVM